MIIDQAPGDRPIRADVCVIGGGPAGIVTALGLARDPGRRVVLLETGGLGFDGRIQASARAEATGVPLGPLHEARVFALGGSTWSWGGICTPPDPVVFEERPWVGDGWPIAAAELDAYRDAAFRWLGVDAETRSATDAAVDDAIATSGLDPASLMPVPVYLSRPTRFGLAYRADLDGAPGVTVALHSTVTRLEVDGGRVVRAVGRSRGAAFAVEASDYVLAGGGIENPRLLLASGIGGRTVGRYFMEHPRVLRRFAVRPGDSPLGRLVGRPGHRYPVRIGLTAETQRRERLVDWHADLRFGLVGQDGPAWDAARRIFIAARRPWNESPFYQDAGGGRLRLRSDDVMTVLRRPIQTLKGVTSAATGHPSRRRWLEVWSSLEQAPDADNRVTLSDRVDDVGLPVATVHWTIGELEERTHRRAMAILLASMERSEPGISAASLDVDDPWPGSIQGTWHHQGTTRMHDDPTRGVVDRDGRVHGVGNLSIVGSSVFPVGASAAPTLTIVQLAMRLADRLAREAQTPVPVGPR